MKNPLRLIRALIEQAKFDRVMSKRRPSKCGEEIRNLENLEFRIKPGKSLDTLARAEQIIRVRAEYETGKPLQWRYPKCSWHDTCRWEEEGRWTQSNWETVLREKQEVRIKPEPQFRPWTYADVPVNAIIRETGWNDCWSSIIGVSTDGAEFTVKHEDGVKVAVVDYQTLYNTHEYSVDGGKTWSQCRVKI